MDLGLRLNMLARRAAAMAVILSCVGVTPDARASEHWQYAQTRRVDIQGLAFAYTRPILYLSFSYRGTDNTTLTPPTVIGIDLETGNAITDVLPCGTQATDPVISPDGTYLAYRFYDRTHLIGVRRLTDGQMFVLPDKSPGIKYPQFFSPDSKTLSYRVGEDPLDPNYDRHSETLLVEYTLSTGERNSWALGVGGAWNLQRLSDDRIIFEAIEPTNREILRRFARRETDAGGLYTTGLIYSFDKSTGALRLDPVNELSTYFREVSPYRHFSLVRVTKGQRYYLVDNGYRAADFVAAYQGKLTQFAPLDGEVREFRISGDEKWLAYAYTDYSDDRPHWQYSEYDEDLGIRNLVTGETRRIDLREPPFSDIAHQQRFDCTSEPAAWLGSPPFDDVAPEPPLIDSTLIRSIVLVLIGLATLTVWVVGGIYSGSVWSALGISVAGTLLSGFVLLIFTVSQPDIGHGAYEFGFVLALIVDLLGYLLPAGVVIAVVTYLVSNFIRRRGAQQDKA